MAKRIKKPANEMSFLDHLEELRWLLVHAAFAVTIGAVGVYFIADWLFDEVLFGPTRATFITYRYFCDLSHQLGFAESICITELPFIIQNTQMEGQINIFVWICILGGFIVSFPYILWLLWRFISPALYDKERKNAKFFIFVSSILFFLGVLFGYFIIVPMSVNFTATFSVSKMVQNQFNIDSYMGLVKTSVLAGGLYFELPIVIYLLSKAGMVTPQFLRKYRKYGIVAILIIAAIVTPPDVVSQIMVAIPMILIYELSIFISASVTRQKLKEEKLKVSEGS